MCYCREQQKFRASTIGRWVEDGGIQPSIEMKVTNPSQPIIWEVLKRSLMWKVLSPKLRRWWHGLPTTTLFERILTWGLKWKKGSEDFSKAPSQLIIATCLLQEIEDGLDLDSPHQPLWAHCQDYKWTLRVMRGPWLRISDGAGNENLLDGTPRSEAAENNKYLCRKQAKVRVVTGAWISQVVKWEDVKKCQTSQIIGGECWKCLWEYSVVRQTALR